MEKNDSIFLDEKQLIEQLEKSKQKRAFECSEKIKEILTLYNCTIVTDVEVLINSKIIQPVIIAL